MRIGANDADGRECLEKPGCSAAGYIHAGRQCLEDFAEDGRGNRINSRREGLGRAVERRVTQAQPGLAAYSAAAGTGIETEFDFAQADVHEGHARISETVAKGQGARSAEQPSILTE